MTYHAKIWLSLTLNIIIILTIHLILGDPKIWLYFTLNIQIVFIPIIFLLGDGKIGVKNDGIYSNSTFQEICGYATVPDPNVPGSLLVYFGSCKFTRL